MERQYRIRDNESRQKKIAKHRQIKIGLKILVVLFPMLLVPTLSYDFLIFYFKHTTVIYSGMVFGIMAGIVLLYIGEKIPVNFLRQKLSI